MSIPRQLLTYLNSGRCFALIGSGLSSGMGYPSWHALALTAIKTLPQSDPEHHALNELMKRQDYPEVFERIANRIGGIGNLLTQIRPSFKGSVAEGAAYKMLCNWPFRCYLTTNYDDEIDRHLRRLGEHFTATSNSSVDLAAITAESKRRIVKLHGDLESADGLVLTTSQYSEFERGGSRQYFRHKLMSIFQMVPVVAVGHSMTDSDFRLVLGLAKESASPENPIYMIVADAEGADFDKLFREFNIRLLSYPNPDKRHDNLLKLLRQIDRFVVSRPSHPRPLLDFPDSAMAEKAVALYIHSALGHGSNQALIQRAIQPQVLSLAASIDGGIAVESIAASLTPESLGRLPMIAGYIDTAVRELAIAGHAGVDSQKQLRATAIGKQLLAETESKRSSEEDQFYGAIRLRLTPFGNNDDLDVLISGLKTALVAVFRRRGLAASELLFRDNSFEPHDMPELFDAVFPAATAVEDLTLRTEYCDAVMDVLTAPNEEQRSYLAHLAQGFFAYHMFGFDPTGQEIRRVIAQETVWVLDSNVLMPLVATGSMQHGFVAKLLTKIRELGLLAITTPKLVAEVDKGLGWMQERLREVAVGSERAALLAIVRSPDYSSNPFVESYIDGHVSGRWRSMPEFLEGIGFRGGAGMRDAIIRHNIEVVDPSRIAPDDGDAIHGLTATILDERVRVGSDRAGSVQAKAEGEVLHVLRHVRQNGFPGRESFKRAYFVSTSQLLDVIYRQTDGLIAWYPETLYNHLSYIEGEAVDPEAVFRGMISSFYKAGISVIDEPAYRQCFKPAISEANATLRVEIDNYVKSHSKTVQEQQRDKESLTAAYQRVPALEKSLFVEQMGWKAARSAKEQLRLSEQQRAETERKAKQDVASARDEYVRKERERTRHDEGRKRNLKDPKHLAKRDRQAKRRRKKR